MTRVPWRSTLVIQRDQVRFNGGHLVPPSQSECLPKNYNQSEWPNSTTKPVQEVFINQSKLFNNNNFELDSKSASNSNNSSILSAIIPKFMINFSYITCHHRS